MESDINISAFLDENGRIKNLPMKRAKRSAVLFYLANKFEENRSYTEKEINSICDAWHTFNDYFILRRGLIDADFLKRKPDGSCYWRNGGTR